MSVRYKATFPDGESMRAAVATEDVNIIRVINNRRNVISFDVSEDDQEHLIWIEKQYGANTGRDYQYQIDSPDIFASSSILPDIPTNASLDDVLDRIKARESWKTLGGDGKGVTIAVVDTGIDGNRPEFAGRQLAGYTADPKCGDPWIDSNGHGTMCACIAAGSRAQGGMFDGVAPGASIMSCKTAFYEVELTAIFDELTDRALAGERIIATNSFGMPTGSSPQYSTTPDLLDAITRATAAGVCVVFSAGNNHDLTGAAQHVCTPTSIWLHKCRGDLMTVAGCKLDDQMWFYSSRGPGNLFGNSGTNKKPDITAPTPENGRILYGSGVRVLQHGWGTSGAAPQVAGLAALLKSHTTALSNIEIFDLIRNSAIDLGVPWECQGAGRVNCEVASDHLVGQS